MTVALKTASARIDHISRLTTDERRGLFWPVP
jgi:hypothetical protein